MAKDEVLTGERLGVEVVRAQMPVDPEPVAAAASANVATVEPSEPTAIELARAAGMLPEMLPGPKLRPAVENPKAWLFRAAKLRFGMSDYDRISGEEFNRRIAAISTVEVR